MKVPFKSISAGRRRRRLEKGSRRGVMLTGALAASVALLAACGSSSHTSSSATTASAGTASGGTSAGTASGGTTGSAGAAASGTVANGTPITIGVVEPDEGALSLGPAMGPGLNGGFYYVNNVLGGAHGHPIKAITCNTDQTPSIEVNCANNFVSKGVVAVFDDYDAGFAAESPILTRAGIPIFGVEVADQHDDNLPSNYFFGPPNEAFAVGPLQIFHQDGLNKATFTIANVPSGVNYVNDAILPVAKKLGMNVKVTYYDASLGQLAGRGQQPFVRQPASNGNDRRGRGRLHVAAQGAPRRRVQRAHLDGQLLGLRQVGPAGRGGHLLLQRRLAPQPQQRGAGRRAAADHHLQPDDGEDRQRQYSGPGPVGRQQLLRPGGFP